MTERERFESWARQRWVHHEDFDQRIKAPSKYNNYEVQAAWDAWQERAAQPAPSVPDLLEALKDMVNLVELMCPFDGPQQRKARAAIARATGEQP